MEKNIWSSRDIGNTPSLPAGSVASRFPLEILPSNTLTEGMQADANRGIGGTSQMGGQAAVHDATTGRGRLLQSNPSKFGSPPPPSILLASLPSSMNKTSSNATAGSKQTDGGALNTRLNTALVVVERSALTGDVVRMVKATMQVYGVSISRLRYITGRTVRARGIVDEHYGKIAEHALLTRPEHVLVEEAKLVPFARVFGEQWEDAVRLGKVCSAKRAAGSLSLSAVDLADKCRQARERGLVVMLNQDCVCCKVDDVYVINGEYLLCREIFMADGEAACCFDVSFQPSQLSFRDFRRKVIGYYPDPEIGSVCATLRRDWRTLGLSAMPGPMTARGIYSSESVLGALRDRIHWGLVGFCDRFSEGEETVAGSDELNKDNIARMLFSRGLSRESLRALLQDPYVSRFTLDGAKRADATRLDAKEPGAGTGEGLRLFQAVLDLDVDECLDLVEHLAAEVAGGAGGSRSGSGTAGGHSSRGGGGGEGAVKEHAPSQTAKRSNVRSNGAEGTGKFGESGPQSEDGHECAELAWQRELRSKTLKEYEALEAQMDALIDTVSQKEAHIDELETQMLHLRLEKEPLISELLQALDGYNTLSCAIAGCASMDLLPDTPALKRPGVNNCLDAGQQDFGQPLPERTKESVGVLEALHADAMRNKVLAAELEEQVGMLVTQRDTQEKVLLNLTAGDTAKSETLGRVQEELEVAVGRVRRLEEELEALRAKKAAEVVRLREDREAEVSRLREEKDSQVSALMEENAGLEQGRVALLEKHRAEVDEILERCKRAEEALHQLHNQDQFCSHNIEVAQEDARKVTCELEKVREEHEKARLEMGTARVAMESELSQTRSQTSCVATHFGRLRCLVLSMAGEFLLEENAMSVKQEDGGASSESNEQDQQESGKHTAAMTRIVEAFPATLDMLERLRDHFMQVQHTQTALVHDLARTTALADVCRGETADMASRNAQLETERAPLVQELVATMESHTQLHKAIRGSVAVLGGVGMVVRVLGAGDVGDRSGGGACSARCMVKRLAEGGPAARSGVVAEGDEILSINGQHCGMLSCEDIEGLFRGPTGSQVLLSLVTRRNKGGPSGGGGRGRNLGGKATAGSVEAVRYGSGKDEDKQFVTVRLTREADGGVDECWESISGKTAESVALAQGLHAEVERLYRILEVEQKRFLRLTNTLKGSSSSRERGTGLVGNTGSQRPALTSKRLEVNPMQSVAHALVQSPPQHRTVGGGCRMVEASGGRVGGTERQDLVGVGMRITELHPYRVVSLVRGGSAIMSGQILEGDVLMAVDGVQVKCMLFSSLRRLLLGPTGSTVSLAFSRRLGRRTSGGGGGHMAGLVGLPGYIDSSRSTVSYSVVLTRGFPSADDLIDVGHHHDGCSGCREADSTGQGTSRVREIVRIGGVEVVLNEDSFSHTLQDRGQRDRVHAHMHADTQARRKEVVGHEGIDVYRPERDMTEGEAYAVSTSGSSADSQSGGDELAWEISEPQIEFSTRSAIRTGSCADGGADLERKSIDADSVLGGASGGLECFRDQRQVAHLQKGGVGGEGGEAVGGGEWRCSDLDTEGKGHTTAI